MCCFPYPTRTRNRMKRIHEITLELLLIISLKVLNAYHFAPQPQGIFKQTLRLQIKLQISSEITFLLLNLNTDILMENMCGFFFFSFKCISSFHNVLLRFYHGELTVIDCASIGSLTLDCMLQDLQELFMQRF